MTDVATFGPIDFVLIEFPGGNDLGPTAQALLDLADRGVVRLYDVTAVRKESDGSFSVLALADIGGGVAVTALSGAQTGLLNDDDVKQAADVLDAGTVAVLIVFENAWARPFVAAALEAGGQVVASQRIPATDVIAALDALDG